MKTIFRPNIDENEEGYYDYQYYDVNHPMHDELGHVHFRTETDKLEYIDGLARLRRVRKALEISVLIAPMLNLVFMIYLILRS